MSEDENRTARDAGASSGRPRSELKPIVLNYGKWKKGNKKAKAAKEGKPKYSKGLEDIQRLEGEVLHVTQTGARAFSKSIDTYEGERRQSAKKKKDGAIDDFIHNSAKATSTYLKEASDIPVDLADSLSRLTIRKNLRKALRRASKRIRTWPL